VTVTLKHIGNGVILHGVSGAIYEVMPGESVALDPADAKSLKGNPDWRPVTGPKPEKETEV
jgi:hypothetical protein